VSLELEVGVCEAAANSAKMPKCLVANRPLAASLVRLATNLGACHLQALALLLCTSAFLGLPVL
jgi:hypothetical protein